MCWPAISNGWNIIVQKPAELARLRHAFLSSPEEIIDEAKNGRMFILVDDEDRENEGDLVIPAQMATPEKINFMARHGRGLICLALSKSRVDALGLDLMSRNNGTRHETAFTVSIEAREGVTTGISAADRARTIAVAIDSSKGKEEIVTPGHVFPLVARNGGVLVRAGHTEAAVDVSRLAGLNPSGVICEIMNEDGTMARMDDLVSFAQLHNLKIGTIRDLIAYRRRHDHLGERCPVKDRSVAAAVPVTDMVEREPLPGVEPDDQCPVLPGHRPPFHREAGPLRLRDVDGLDVAALVRNPAGGVMA